MYKRCAIFVVACIVNLTAGAHYSGRSLRHTRPIDNLRQKQLLSFPSPAKKLQHNTEAASKFRVNGTSIPEVNFDIGESYAGLLPISNTSNDSELYFWFFPSSNADASDEILIWLNGGPGCSSLEGLLQENGPFLWQYGTYKPVPNPYTWTKLTNVVWIDQPVGSGFSRGTPTAKNEEDVAAQFSGFWQNFVDTFDLRGRKIYITGESYAGYYVPYIADAFLNHNDTEYYNVQGTMIYDPSVTTSVVDNQIPAVAFVDYWHNLMPFNETFMTQLHNMSASCGYDDFLQKYLTYPPLAPLPQFQDLPGTDQNGETLKECDVFSSIYSEIFLINPCWDVYQVATTCPALWDVLGYPASSAYLPEGASIYFNRTDVQKAINAPIGQWAECSSKNVFVGGGDTSLPSGVSVLPGVIERSKRTIIAHGDLDMVLIANGTLLMIQNMTWGGAQGFTSQPRDPFYVPHYTTQNPKVASASGIMGITHTERGLTWIDQRLSGHMVPQYQPSSAYRHLEFLLGRIDSLSNPT
ncbi:cpdS/carboxypeptidase [Blumeria hordei DH14]|uniref:Carboxypeptidase n=1 Tax=Blumeria graminis f. sp. hordei (strain DH14) TaxID=546991 RepID=N1JE77_BLUG1|nr:cpdS/carboxypeptidase [Blumeria hordei DH14]